MSHPDHSPLLLSVESGAAAGTLGNLIDQSRVGGEYTETGHTGWGGGAIEERQREGSLQPVFIDHLGGASVMDGSRGERSSREGWEGTGRGSGASEERWREGSLEPRDEKEELLLRRMREVATLRTLEAQKLALLSMELEEAAKVQVETERTLLEMEVVMESLPLSEERAERRAEEVALWSAFEQDKVRALTRKRELKLPWRKAGQLKSSWTRTKRLTIHNSLYHVKTGGAADEGGVS